MRDLSLGKLKDRLYDYVKSSDYLVSITHPSTVLSKTGKKHPLVSFDIAEVERNLNTILAECNNINKKVRFVTIADFRELKG